MISKCFTLAFSIFIAGQLNAQLSIGVKSGYTRAWQNYGDVIVPSDAVTHVHGFHATALTYWKFNRYFEIGIEPGFIKRGAACVPGWNQGINPNPVFPGDSKFLLDYIELPLMIKGNLPLFKGKLAIFGKLGYGNSILVNAIRENETSGERTDMTKSNQIRRWDHGLYSSFGFGVNFKSSQLFVSSDYYYGLINAEGFTTSKNRSLNFSVGYSITF
jgi:hypothetical protein